MEQKRSQSLILPSSEVKARRLKLLQNIETRRLETINRQLSRAEHTALRQLDFQRMQFRRRLSDVSVLLGTDFPTHHTSGSCAQSGESSPGYANRPPLPPLRFVRSLSKAGGALEHEVQDERIRKTSVESVQVSDGDTEQRPPFWLRLPSLGIPTDDAEIFVDFESPKAESTSNPGPSPSTTTTHDSDNSPAGKSDISGTGDRFTFSPADIKSVVSGERRNVTDTRPLWLKALKKLREQRYARLNGQQAEECEQLAALVTGCSFSNSICTSPKPTVAKHTGIGSGTR